METSNEIHDLVLANIDQLPPMPQTVADVMQLNQRLQDRLMAAEERLQEQSREIEQHAEILGPQRGLC